MAEASSAADLLRDIQTASASHWLASLRYHTAPFGPSFIEGLDAVVSTAHPRATPEAPFNAGDVVEIQGESSTGKTQILLHLALVTALPSSAIFQLWSPESSDLLQETIEVGGKGHAVAVFDLDGRFDLNRLQRMMRLHLDRRVNEHCEEGPPQARQARASPQEVQAQVDQALGRILYYTPSSLLSLAAAIKLLSKTAAESIPDQSLSLVLIDSITATHHQDAWDLERARQSAAANVTSSANSVKNPLPQHPMRQVLRALGSLRKDTGITTFMTSTAYAPLSTKSPFYRTVLPAPYPTPFAQDAPRQTHFDPTNPLNSDIPLPLTHHITLHARPLAQLPSTVTMEQASGDAGKQRRYLANHRQVMRGYVRLAGVGPVNRADGESALAGHFDLKVLESGIDA